MTYKLELGTGKIVSSVVLILPEGAKEEFASGTEVCEKSFDRKYVVEEICAVNSSIEITLSEADSLNDDESLF